MPQPHLWSLSSKTDPWERPCSGRSCSWMLVRKAPYHPMRGVPKCPSHLCLQARARSYFLGHPSWGEPRSEFTAGETREPGSCSLLEGEPSLSLNHQKLLFFSFSGCREHLCVCAPGSGGGGRLGCRSSLGPQFYHACDQPGDAVLCILNYDTLQYCDFLGSGVSIWVTVLCMARLKASLKYVSDLLIPGSGLVVSGCLRESEF